jgi:hypothetical protein
LKSNKVVDNIESIYHLKEVLSTNKVLAYKLAQLEQKMEKHDGEIQLIFDAIRQLMVPPETKRKKIGLKREKEGQELIAEG